MGGRVIRTQGGVFDAVDDLVKDGEASGTVFIFAEDEELW